MVWSIVLSFSFVKTSPVCFLSDSNIYLSGAVEAFSSRNNSVLVIMVTNPGTEVWRMYHHQRMW